jgi:simple sugar transport system permease protein
MMDTELIGLGFVIAMAAASIRIATSIMYATLGEMITERSGILNLGIEGLMIFGAMTAFITTYVTHSLTLGVLSTILVGLVEGLIMAVVYGRIGTNQHVWGVAFTIANFGLAYFIYRLYFGGTAGVMSTITPYAPVKIPFLADIPVIGPILFQQYAYTYVALILFVIFAIVFKYTIWGLIITVVGDNPAAADTAGISVYRTRYFTVTMGAIFMALGGSFLSIAQFNAFLFEIVAGRGWIAIALVTLGNWKPMRCLLAAISFGFIDALQLRMQALGMSQVVIAGTAVTIPFQLFLALPYVLTILFLLISSRTADYPTALLTPYRREE